MAHSRFLCWLALGLALHDDARGQVRDAHRRLGLVDVLAARAGGAERVDAQVVVLEIDLVIVSSICGNTNTDANDVWRRCAASNGEMRTRRCTPDSLRMNP